MDDLELAASAVIAISERQPKEGCSHDDLKLFSLRKNLDTRYAIANLGLVLRARLAQKYSTNPAETSGSAVRADTSSLAANNRKRMEQLAATATISFTPL